MKNNEKPQHTSQGAYITNSCQINKYNYSNTNRHCTEKNKKLR